MKITIRQSTYQLGQLRTLLLYCTTNRAIMEQLTYAEIIDLSGVMSKVELLNIRIKMRVAKANKSSQYKITLEPSKCEAIKKAVQKVPIKEDLQLLVDDLFEQINKQSERNKQLLMQRITFYS